MTFWQWFGTWWPLVTPLAVALLAASATGVWAIINRRGGEKARAKAPLPPTWPEMWARIDALEKTNGELRDKNAALEGRMDDMERHMERLEQMIPDPPGVPPRPWETTVEVHSGI